MVKSNFSFLVFEFSSKKRYSKKHQVLKGHQPRIQNLIEIIQILDSNTSCNYMEAWSRPQDKSHTANMIKDNRTLRGQTALEMQLVNP